MKKLLARIALFGIISFSTSLQAKAADPDVIFVGAGPVGLYTAIQAKLYHPEMRIHFFEQYKVYQRKHTVQINQHSFKNSHDNRDFKKLLKGLGKSVRTSELEDQLLCVAGKLGITVEYKKITNLEEIRTQYPLVKIIIGSDGSHSMVREHFLSRGDLGSQDLAYTAEVKYESLTETRELSMWTEIPLAMPKVNHTVMEHVGRPSADQKTPVTIRVMINKEEYEDLKPKTTFKKPIFWNSKEVDAKTLIPQALYQTIKYWLYKRQKMTHEKVDPASVKVTVTNLPEYYSPEVHFVENGIHYFLVGDAAFGVPYFRSINNGFESGNVLARVMAKLINPALHFEKILDPKVDTASVAYLNKVNYVHMIKQSTPKDYQRFVMGQQTREQLLAHLKTIAVRIWDDSVGSSQFLYHSKVGAVSKVSSKEEVEEIEELEVLPRVNKKSSTCTLF